MVTLEITVLRHNHTYSILLDPGLGGKWKEQVERSAASHRYLVLVDATVAGLRGFPPSGTVDGAWRYLWVRAGEENKNFDQYRELCERCLEMDIDRKTVIVAIGGGVTGDLAGFVAATLLRGLALVQVPTTLLAQVDSSVGGKNGIDTVAGKNMVGTFHQPEVVLIDPMFLDTLPKREYVAGLAEMVKTAVLDSRDFFDKLARNADLLRAREHCVLNDCIAQCCRVKARIVAADEMDMGARFLLNLGHTFGHALETLAGYDGNVVHGEAVAVGLCLAAQFAREAVGMPAADVDDVVNLLAALELPVTIGQLGRDGAKPVAWEEILGVDILATALRADKKKDRGHLALVLPHAIGDCRIVRGFEAEEVAEFMMGRL